MVKRSSRKITSWLICMMLIVAMALTAVGCGNSQGNTQPAPETQSEAASAGNIVGEGETQFMFTVVDKDGNETNFEVHTNQATVGAALLELNLIAGDESEYGLYVKTVNGITADYDADQT